MEEKMNWNEMEPEEIINALKPMHRSKVHKEIRDNISSETVKRIESHSVELKQEWQNIKMEAKQSDQHDRTMATMLDVDKACTNVYMILLQLMKASNEDHARIINMMAEAINRIEEKVWIEKTEWATNEDSNVEANTSTD